jgi:sensor histidine kinase YesM
MPSITRFLTRIGLPLTLRQFWLAALLFWGVFEGTTFLALRVGEWLEGGPVSLTITDFVNLLTSYLSSVAITPVILYAAQRFPLTGHSRGKFMQVLLIHVLVLMVLNALICALLYVVSNWSLAWEFGRSNLPITKVYIWFSASLSAMLAEYMLLVVGYNILLYINQFRSLQQQHLQMQVNHEQLKGQLANAQLQTLKMQLNPHFLFNTLHTIVSLIIRNQARKAALMVTTLSDLLRSVLARQHANFIPLRDELLLTKQYLSIQEIRFEDRLTVEYIIDPDARDCPVPQLILQPLVENAITHGVADLTTGGLIRITARRLADQLIIDVFDNGVGQNQLQNTSGTGLGLTNTLSRLEQAYGLAAQFRFEQPPGGSTTVSLIIPCHYSLDTSSADYVSVSHAHH